MRSLTSLVIMLIAMSLAACNSAAIGDPPGAENAPTEPMPEPLITFKTVGCHAPQTTSLSSAAAMWNKVSVAKLGCPAYRMIDPGTAASAKADMTVYCDAELGIAALGQAYGDVRPDVMYFEHDFLDWVYPDTKDDLVFWTNVAASELGLKLGLKRTPCDQSQGIMDECDSGLNGPTPMTQADIEEFCRAQGC